MKGLRPTRIDLSDAIERIVWTFAQAFMGTITFEALVSDPDAVRAAGIAGLASVWTGLSTLFRQRLKELDDG